MNAIRDKNVLTQIISVCFRAMTAFASSGATAACPEKQCSEFLVLHNLNADLAGKK